MAFPALSQTYYADVNYPLDSSSALNYAKSTLFAWKAILKKEVLTANTGSITGWTCAGSSDSVTAGMDGVDRWTSTYDPTKIVRGSGVAHSWIVLQNATLGIWFIIDYSSTVDNQIILVLCRTAPTGGSITARPTSTDQTICWNNNVFCDTSAAYGLAHRVTTADGLFFIFTTKPGTHIVTNVLGFWPVGDTKSGDTNPWVFIADYASTGAMASGNVAVGQWRSNTGLGGRLRDASDSSWLGAVPGFWSGNNTLIWFGQVQASLEPTGTFDYATIYMLSTSSATVKGRLLDFYQGPSRVDGQMHPTNTSSPTHVSIGQIFIPFPGATPRI